MINEKRTLITHRTSLDDNHVYYVLCLFKDFFFKCGAGVNSIPGCSWVLHVTVFVCTSIPFLEIIIPWATKPLFKISQILNKHSSPKNRSNPDNISVN